MGAQHTWAKIIGIILILVGIIGFFTGTELLGFGINSLHNIVHILTGLIFAWAGFSAKSPAKKTNQWLGIIYVLISIIGFFGVLSFLNVNSADNYLHLAIGLVSAIVGFGSK